MIPGTPRLLPRLPTLHQLYLGKRRVDTRSIMQKLMDARRGKTPYRPVRGEDIQQAMLNRRGGRAGLRKLGVDF